MALSAISPLLLLAVKAEFLIGVIPAKAGIQTAI
jgi:hypothetical protein